MIQLNKILLLQNIFLVEAFEQQNNNSFKKLKLISLKNYSSSDWLGLRSRNQQVERHLKILKIVKFQ